MAVYHQFYDCHLQASCLDQNQLLSNNYHVLDYFYVLDNKTTVIKWLRPSEFASENLCRNMN